MDTSFQAMPSSMLQVGHRLYQMCPPCLRTPVHYVSGPYMGRGEPILVTVAVSDRFVEVSLCKLNSLYRFFQRMPSFVSSMT